MGVGIVLVGLVALAAGTGSAVATDRVPDLPRGHELRARAGGVLTEPGPSNAPGTRMHHVTICHATGSEKHPYVRISPSETGVLRGHAGLHHQDGRDIIPPFGSFPGQNWDATGQAIYENGCVPPAPVPIPGGSTGILALTALLGLALAIAHRRTAAGRRPRAR